MGTMQLLHSRRFSELSSLLRFIQRPAEGAEPRCRSWRTIDSLEALELLMTFPEADEARFFKERGGGSTKSEQGVELVSWPRTLPAHWGSELAVWAKQQTVNLRLVGQAELMLDLALPGLTAECAQWLKRDMYLLADQVARLSGAQSLTLSLETVRTDQCRKFHVDFIRYRLVTTYVGPGTEWVPEEAVCRAALAHSLACPCDANKKIVPDLSAVRRAETGEVLWMKGARQERAQGVVHRSPPIEESGETRLVFIASVL